ncbi:MAG: hypothetical protein IPK17_01620 [Chloroflexi bacterium]|uniref:hypothetical protein n=1 Tax=Candidatus Flexifilum breve TaxID=3140694 RepID=UPI0031348550|nr:hypothetical protein [Chloroflexota bacterium]
MTATTTEPNDVPIEEVMRTLTEGTRCLTPHPDTGALELSQHGHDVARQLIREKLDCYFEYEKWLSARLNPATAMIRLLTNYTSKALAMKDEAALFILKPKMRYSRDGQPRPPIVPWGE